MVCGWIDSLTLQTTDACCGVVKNLYLNGMAMEEWISETIFNLLKQNTGK